MSDCYRVDGIITEQRMIITEPVFPDYDQVFTNEARGMWGCS
ncbi:hypothetical protein ACX0G7_15300 [Flavitalea antarctica]